MPIESVVRNVKYFHEYFNGVDFDQNLSEFAANLVGNVTSRVKFNCEILVKWYATPSPSTKWEVQKTYITRTSGSFFDDGFWPLQAVIYVENWPTINKEGVLTAAFSLFVDSISEDGKTMFYTVSGIPTDNDPYIGLQENFALVAVNDSAFTSRLTGLIYKWGLIDNTENFNYISKVSGNDQVYYKGDIGKFFDTTFKDMIPIGIYNDWLDGSAKIRYVSTDNNWLTYELEHIFEVKPHYLDGQLPNLTGNIVPGIFSGENNLKHVFSFEWRKALNEPNAPKISTTENIEASTGWFNENFNGFDNIYTVESVQYSDPFTLDPRDGFSFIGRSKATITISKAGGFVVPEKIGLFVSYLPTQDEYTDTITDQQTNFLYDKLHHVANQPGVVGTGIIKSLVSNIDGANIVIEVEIEYTSLQSARLTKDNLFMIAVDVADSSLSFENSDFVTLLADVKNYVDPGSIAGLINFNLFRFYQHNETPGVDLGNNSVKSWNEDGLEIEFEFEVDLNNEVVINSMSFALVAYNESEDKYFVLDQFVFQTASFIILPDNSQQINIDETRGYILANGSQFNLAQLSIKNQVGDIVTYQGKLGQKVSWQSWVSNSAVDLVFFDASQENDNLNNKSSNYAIFKNGYRLRMLVLSDISGLDSLGRQARGIDQYLSGEIANYDYDLDSVDPPIWSGEIKTFDPDTMSDLGGAILSNKNTLFRAVWTFFAGPVTDLADIWAINRIEESGDIGSQINELSSIRPFPSSNILIPLEGETQLKVYLDAGLVFCECLIDFTRLGPGSYNLSARINQ